MYYLCVRVTELIIQFKINTRRYTYHCSEGISKILSLKDSSNHLDGKMFCLLHSFLTSFLIHKKMGARINTSLISSQFVLHKPQF